MNQEFENKLEMVTSEFSENLKKYLQIVCIHHTDADGIAGGAIITTMLNRLFCNIRRIAFNLTSTWKEFLDSIRPSIKQSTALIFIDLSPSASDISSFIEYYPEIDIYLLDHHIFQTSPKIQLPENIYNCNPTLFGLNGLKEIAGSTLSYLFAKKINERNKDLGWIAAIGMGGDVLDHFDQYQSYNRAVIEEAAELGYIEIKSGLCAYGGMYESIENGLAMSILPYIPLCEGQSKKAKQILESLGIDPKKKIINLSSIEIEKITQKLNPSLKGDYIVIPKKEGIFHFTFEHAHFISFNGYDHANEMFESIEQKKPTLEQKNLYKEDILKIVKNLTTFIKLPRKETQFAIIIDTSNLIETKAWSDTASFAGINKIFDITKILFLGGLENDLKNTSSNPIMKFSVRCSSDFIALHHNKGINIILSELIKLIGGSGGGHPLAGGLRIPFLQFNLIQEKIDNIIEAL